MNFTMFVNQMGQPNFDSEPIPLHGIVKFRTEPIPKNLPTFCSKPYRTLKVNSAEP